MASHQAFQESYYGSSPAANPSSSSSPSSPGPPAPPPPPPKSQPHSQGPSHSGTPSQSFSGISNGSSIPPDPSTSTPPQPPPHPHFNPMTSPPPNFTPQPSHIQQGPAPIPPPSLQDHWLPPDIASKSISDLQHLLASPQLLSSISQSHPSYASSTAALSQLLQSNIALAQQISTLESQLRQLRDQTAQLALNHTSLQTQWRRKQAEMDDALSPWGPRAMYQRLVSSIGEQEALLRAMTESFLDGSAAEDGGYGGTAGTASEKEVTDWLRRIREGTAVLEKRREMRARWDEGRVGGWR